MYKKNLTKPYWRIVLSLVLTLPMLLPHSALAVTHDRPQMQHASVVQCVESLLLFLNGQLSKAKPALEMAVIEAKSALEEAMTSPLSKVERNALGMCALLLGMIHHSTSDWVEALAAYTVAQDAFTANEDPQMTWVSTFIIGTVYLAQGRFPEAYLTLQQTLASSGAPTTADEKVCADPSITADLIEQPWTTESLKPFARAINLNNIGLAIATPLSQQQNTGATYEKAQSCLTAALQLLQQLSAQSANPDAMLSDLLLQVALGGGISEDALDDLLTTLIISTLVPELAKAFEPIVLSNLGQVYTLQENYDEAQAHLEQALRQIQANQAQNNIAELQAVLPLLDSLRPLLGSDLDPGLQTMIQILPELLSSLARVSAIINLNGEAIVLNNLALVYNAQGQTEKAQTTFEEALVIFENKLGSAQNAISVHVNLGWLAQQAGDNGTALDHYEQAIQLLPSVRSVAEGDIAQLRGGNVQTLNLVGNEGILSQQADVYALAANLYLQQDKPIEALQALEQGRARLFLDMMSVGSPQLSDTDAALLSAVREAFDLRTQANISLTQLQSVGGADRALLSRAERESESAEDLYNTQLAALEAHNPSLLSLAPGMNTVIDLEALQSLLNDQTSLLVYYVAEEILEEPTNHLAIAWVITKQDIKAVKLETTGTELQTTIRFLRNSIEAKTIDLQAAAILYDKLFAPLKPYVQGDQLIIVPYGSLHYLPFAALWDNQMQRYLLEGYTLTHEPSISSLRLIQHNRNLDEGNMLVMGNPDTLPKLKGSEKEAQAIAKLYDVTPFLAEEATETQLREQAGTADIIHLAAHGGYDTIDPLLSSIELTPDQTNDGSLQVREVFRLDLSKANLVVLSACETALGEQSLGDEIIGLTRAFLYAGTPSIMTTLWSIEDNASEALMTTFYQKLRTEPSFAAALRAAQLDILSKENWRDPFYWAAFTLHGDYLGVGERQANPTTGLLPVTTPTAINTPSVAATPTPPPVAQLEVLVNTLNVRSGPGTAYAVIGQLKVGNQVAITGQDEGNGWLEICCVDGQSGWVIRNENYIRLQGEIDSVPQK